MTRMEVQAGKVEAQLKHWGAKLDELKTAGGKKRETITTAAKGAWNKVVVAFTKLKN